LLHDIARPKESSGEVECHAAAGADIAQEILAKTGFPKEKIPIVAECIRVHRFSKGLEPKSQEAAILQDADRLDALGAITIARIFTHGGNKGRPIYDPSVKLGEIKGKGSSSLHHFYKKQLKLKPETFKTKIAQAIAKKRYQFILAYINQFLKEWEGEI